MPPSLRNAMTLVAATFLSIGGYDVVLYLVYGRRATVSYQALGYSADHRWFPFLLALVFAFLARHLFHDRRVDLWSTDQSLVYAVLGAASGLALGGFWLQGDEP